MNLVLKHRPKGLLVSRACRAVGLPRSSFYSCASSPAREHRLDSDVGRICAQFPFYGYRRASSQLNAEGCPAGPKAVRASMKRLGLSAKRRLPRRRTTCPVPVDAENLLSGLRISSAGVAMGSDATWLPFGSGRGLYLAVVLDLFTRQVLGYSLGTRLNAQLAVQALARAVGKALPKPGWVHHSDRGSTYASSEYRICVAAASGRMSFAQAGKPWQNGIVESFFKTLKYEQINRNEYPDPASLVESVHAFVRFYNEQRLHSGIGNKAPDQFAQEVLSNG